MAEIFLEDVQLWPCTPPRAPHPDPHPRGRWTGNEISESTDLISFAAIVSEFDLPQITLSHGPGVPLNRNSNNNYPVALGTGSFSEVGIHEITPAEAVQVEKDPSLAAKSRVALKKYLVTSAQRDAPRVAREAILKELRTLCHPHIRNEWICPLLFVGWDTTSDIPLLGLQLAQFGNLQDLASASNLSPLLCFRLLQDVASGLQVLHRHGIVHCDLKPQNILVFRSTSHLAVAKLSDFGEAIFIKEQNWNDTVGLKGTRLWQPPERSIATISYAGMVDIYSFGLVSVSLFCNLGRFFLYDKSLTPMEWIWEDTEPFAPSMPLSEIEKAKQRDDGASDSILQFAVSHINKKLEPSIFKDLALEVTRGCLRKHAAHRLQADDLLSAFRNWSGRLHRDGLIINLVAWNGQNQDPHMHRS